MAGLICKRVLHSVEDLPKSAESFAAVMDEEQHSPPHSPGGDPVTPFAGGGTEVRPPLSMPKFEPLSLATKVSLASHVDLHLELWLVKMNCSISCFILMWIRKLKCGS